MLKYKQRRAIWSTSKNVSNAALAWQFVLWEQSVLAKMARLKLTRKNVFIVVPAKPAALLMP